MTLSSSFQLFSKVALSLCQKRVPGQVIIQMTDRCNALCPHCGMRASSTFARKDLSPHRIRRIIDHASMNQVAAVSFTGGEPLLRIDDLASFIRHAGASGIPFIRTGTNGFFMRSNGGNKDRFRSRVSRVIETLANTPLRNFWISIDSYLPEVHEAMRGLKGVFRGIEASIPLFHQFGLYPSVNLGVNRNVGGALTANLHRSDYDSEATYLEEFHRRYAIAIQAFYRRVIDMGFTILNTCYPMSINDSDDNAIKAVYAATSPDRIVRFTRSEKAVLFKVLMECVQMFRSKIRIFSPMSSLYSLARHYGGRETLSLPASGCRGGADFFFIDARKGDTYPCGYRGNDNMGDYTLLDRKKVPRDSHCRLCDWECFRDPSEQTAPLLLALSSPFRLVNHMFSDPLYFRYWTGDLLYYRSCGFFDGRKPL